MKFNLTLSKFVVIVAILALFTAISSCYKKKDTISIITVVDSNESPVVGANVRLFYEDSTNSASLIDIENQTTEDGSAIFTFNEFYKEGQGGFAVLDIEVDGDFKGVVMIEEMVTNKKTVYL